MTRKDKNEVSASRVFDSPFSPNFEMRSFSAQFRVKRGQEIRLKYMEWKRIIYFIAHQWPFFISILALIITIDFLNTLKMIDVQAPSKIAKTYQ